MDAELASALNAVALSETLAVLSGLCMDPSDRQAELDDANSWVEPPWAVNNRTMSCLKVTALAKSTMWIVMNRTMVLWVRLPSPQSLNVLRALLSK